jgi:hypothetical protein
MYLRLDIETDGLLDKLATETGTNRSHVIRLAVRELARRRLPKEALSARPRLSPALQSAAEQILANPQTPSAFERLADGQRR